MDDHNQLNQYTNAFDSLRNSINQLSTPLNNISTNLNGATNNLLKTAEALKKLTVQNQDFTTASEKSDNKLKETAETFMTWKEVVLSVKGAITSCETALKGWGLALTGGLTALTILLPELWKLYSAYLKGKEATDGFKKNQEALTAAFKNSLFTKAVTDVNGLTASIKSAKSGYGEKAEVLKKYNETLGETLGKTNSLEEAENKITKNGRDYVKMMFYKAAAASALSNSSGDMLDATQKVIEAENKKAKIDKEVVDFGKNILENERRLGKNQVTLGKFRLKAKQEAAAEELKEAEAHKVAIEETTTKLYTNLEKQANDLIKKIAPVPKNVETKSGRDKQYWESELTKQQGLLDKLDGSSKSFEKQAKSIKKRMTAIKKTLANYSTISINAPDKEPEAAKQDPLDQFKKKIDDFDKYLNNQRTNKAGYEKELTDLKLQLAKKLITQEDYYKQWAALQERYRIDIAETLKRFNEDDLAETLQHQKDLVDAEKQKGIIDKDESSLKKAFLPKDKLEAEKQLISDKYNFEIQKAAEAGRDTAEIRKRYQDDISATEKQYEQDRKNFQIETAQQVSNAAFSILQNNLRSQSSARLKQLETQKNAELGNTSLTATQRKAIEEKYKKKEAEEKTKAFKAEQRASILQAVINGALAITKVTSQAGLLGAFVIPGIIASTAIQVATIAAQKAPQYAKGGLHYRSDGKGALLAGYSRIDDTNAYLRSGEAVVVSEAMRNPWARNLVSAINVAHGGRDFSVQNPGSGYAIGGIFTDGGNSNRYYSQPLNDQKDLANTIAYQMINNFPPVYVDVKDINSQQNILARTVDRVNL